jgi:uncharacterized protein YpiB (UPF0302 family)
MSEIIKLRTRLKNVQKNVIEYRMTVVEAKNLLKEIDVLLTVKEEKPLPQVVLNEPAERTRIIDGGAF